MSWSWREMSGLQPHNLPIIIWSECTIVWNLWYYHGNLSKATNNRKGKRRLGRTKEAQSKAILPRQQTQKWTSKCPLTALLKACLNKQKQPVKGPPSSSPSLKHNQSTFSIWSLVGSPGTSWKPVNCKRSQNATSGVGASAVTFGPEEAQRGRGQSLRWELHRWGSEWQNMHFLKKHDLKCLKICLQIKVNLWMSLRLLYCD